MTADEMGKLIQMHADLVTKLDLEGVFYEFHTDRLYYVLDKIYVKCICKNRSQY